MNSKLSRRDDQRLSDIAAAAEAIAEHVSLLDSDEIPESVLIDAIKYNLVSIGEAANHVSEALKKQHSDIEWPAIVGLRNVLTHEYFRVNPGLIVQIARDSVPGLLKQVRAISE